MFYRVVVVVCYISSQTQNLLLWIPTSFSTETTKEFVAKLDLKPGQKVLDVGCGIGGGDFYMAEKFDVDVIGIDLSVNMISFALERAIGLKCSVEFEVADCTKKTYPNNSFDVIYSRDTILHIQVIDFSINCNASFSVTWHVNKQFMVCLIV